MGYPNIHEKLDSGLFLVELDFSLVMNWRPKRSQYHHYNMVKYFGKLRTNDWNIINFPKYFYKLPTNHCNILIFSKYSCKLHFGLIF